MCMCALTGLLPNFIGFCPEIKSIGTNGPLSLKKVGNFRKYGAQYEANSVSAFRQVEKT